VHNICVQVTARKLAEPEPERSAYDHQAEALFDQIDKEQSKLDVAGQIGSTA